MVGIGGSWPKTGMTGLPYSGRPRPDTGCCGVDDEDGLTGDIVREIIVLLKGMLPQRVVSKNCDHHVCLRETLLCRYLKSKVYDNKHDHIVERKTNTH